jgi:spermidine/putrescine transport system permease protein
VTRLRAWFLAPAWLWLAALFAAPFAIVLAFSLLTRGSYGGLDLPWTLESYERLADQMDLRVFLRSFWMSALATATWLVLGFPVALFISRAGRRKNLYLQLVILPFWTSFLVRIYAFLFLLRDTGLINTTLQALGVIRDPLPLLYNDGAVLLGLVYGYLPFMVLPLYATLERLDPSLVEAAADLGARPWTAFRTVVLPVLAPAVAAGSVFTFSLSLGDYITVQLVGGTGQMLGNLVYQNFSTDLPFAAAVAVLPLLVMAAYLLTIRRTGALDRL